MASLLGRIFGANAEPQAEEDIVVEFNVGGKIISTTVSTLRKSPESKFMQLADILVKQSKGKSQDKLRKASTVPRRSLGRSTTSSGTALEFTFDANGKVFLDRDPTHVPFILKYLRLLSPNNTIKLAQLRAPTKGTNEYLELIEECEFYQLNDLLLILDPEENNKMEEQVIEENVDASEDKPTVTFSEVEEPKRPVTSRKGSRRKNSRKKSSMRFARDDRRVPSVTEQQSEETLQRMLVEQLTQDEELSEERLEETVKVELQRLQYEKDKLKLESKNVGKVLKYNLLVVGVTGTGKSSSLNTLLNKQICKVSGAQAQGTKGCVLREGAVLDDNFISFIDTQGLGADTSISDVELLSNIMISTESIMKLGIINNILISFDLNTRATPATMANQLTLIELFQELKRSCFLAFTKWNSTGVQMEWNSPLRNWIKKWKRAATVEEITEDPPSYEVMYQAYCTYIVSAMANELDGGAFSKMASFLAFFGARVLWMYNLDAAQIEDRETGDLPAFEERLYTFYRNRCLDTLERGSTEIHTDDLTFLKSGKDSMLKVATELIKRRDAHIQLYEATARDPVRFQSFRKAFEDLANETCRQIGLKDFEEALFYTTKLAQVAGIVQTAMAVGCILQ